MGTPNFSVWHSAGLIVSNLPTPCSPKLFLYTTATKPPQAIPPVTSTLFYTPHSSQFTQCIRPVHRLKSHSQAQTWEAFSLWWICTNRTVGKLTPITTKLCSCTWHGICRWYIIATSHRCPFLWWSLCWLLSFIKAAFVSQRSAC